MKYCTQCGVEKSYSDFGRCKANNDGYQYRCKECLRAANKKWYQDNKAEASKKRRAWVKEDQKINPDRWRNYDHRRRALEVGELPVDYWQQLITLYGDSCMNPDCKVGAPLTLDHVVPLSKGGIHAMSNLQILCKSCNSAKGNRSSDDYRSFLVV